LNAACAAPALASPGVAVASDSGPYLDRSYKVPKEYQSKYASLTDHTAEDAPVTRYRDAYEAFWWNCVAVKAATLDNRCPFMASGWPGEVAGASDGASRASDDIHALLKKYGAATVQAYLRKLASPPSMIKAKLQGRFDKPTADPHGL
jgi:hypothetical protein